MKIGISKFKKLIAMFMMVMMLFNVLYTFSAFAETVSSQAKAYLKVNDVELNISDEVDTEINVKSGDKLEIGVEYDNTYFNSGDTMEVVIPVILNDIKFKYSSDDIEKGVIAEEVEGVIIEDNVYKLMFNEDILEKAQGSIIILATVGEISDGVDNGVKIKVIDGEFNIILDKESVVEDVLEEPVVEEAQDQVIEEQEEVIPQQTGVLEETTVDEVAVDQSEDVAVAAETQTTEIDTSTIEGIAYGILDNSKIIGNPYVAKNGFNVAGITSVAFDFHIFSNSSILNAHTQGNIATKDLEAGGKNFGSRTNESNYFENSANGINGIDSNGNTVIGTGISASIEDNGNKVVIGSGGVALAQEQSQLVYKQIDGREMYININGEFSKLKSISDALASKGNSTGITLSELNGENQSITVEPSNGKVNYYLNVKASDISDGNSKRVLNISVPSGITLIINVDMAGVNQDYLSNIVINLNSATNGEGNVGTENNVLWNLRNGDRAFTSDGYAKVGCSDYFMGTILAPEADIQYGALNGSVIANKTMQNGQESHKWDFTGHNGDDEEIQIEPTKTALEGTKILEGKDLAEGMFNFVVLEGETQVATGTNNSEGKIVFSEIVYSEEGTHEYTVKEVKGDSEGVTYDVAEYKVTVNVVAGEDGQLVANVAYPEGGVVFTNKYAKPTVEVKPTKTALEGTKILEGKDLAEGMFNFVVLEGETQVATGTNNSEGKIVFSEIVYSEEGTHEYTVKEVKGDSEGVTYDVAEYKVTVNVVAGEDGQLVANVAYPEGGVVFTNKYEKPIVEVKPTKTALEGTKILEGKDLAEGMFNFVVLEGETQVATGTNNSEGKIVFSEIVYSEEGTHEYTVKEVKGDSEGVTYDVAEYKVTVNVVAGEDGQLVANVAYPEGGVVFTNKYEEAKAVVTLEATKKLTGKTLEDGMFCFEVVDKDGAVVSTGKNAADGKITFNPITFDKAGDYSFKVREVNNGLKGVIYDTTEFNVTVNVASKGKGKLEATVSYVENGIVFNNKYETNVTAVVLEATKKLAGKDLEADMFLFEVIDENNKIVSSGKNDKSGKIIFNLINYNTPGTYKYTIREVKGTLDGITYDNTTYKVTVTVKDDGKGALSATIDYPKSGVIFNNTYKDSITVNPENPKTGDKSIIVLVVIVIVAGGGLALLHRKRNKK